MSTKKLSVAAKAAPADPSLPYEEILIDGATYKMVFKYSALAAAEARLSAMGYDVSLLVPMLRWKTFSSIRILFAVSLFAYHPELDPEVTQDWVTQEMLPEIFLAIDKAWKKSTPEGKPGNPPKPAE
jgi:hypothetical protein